MHLKDSKVFTLVLFRNPTDLDLLNIVYIFHNLLDDFKSHFTNRP